MKRLDVAGAMVILLPWVAMVMLTADMITVPLTVLGFILCFFRGRLDISRTQWLIWSLLGVVLFVGAFRSDAHRALASGLVYANLYPVAMALGWASLPAILRRHTRRQYWMALTLSGVFFLIAGLNLMPMMIEFSLMSALWMALFCVSTRSFLTATRPRLGALLSLIPTMALFALLAAAFTYSEVQFGWLMRLLSAGSDISLTFPSQNRLNTMLSSETNPAVVARCFSLRPNTYLPARVYTNYKEGIWTEFGPSSEAKSSPAADGNRYLLAQPQPPAGTSLHLERFEVHASPIVLFTPRDAAWLECNQATLAMLSGHLLEQRGGGNDLQAYTVARIPGADLAPPESEEYLKACLKLPDHLDPIVAQTAREVLGAPGDPWKRGLQCQNWFHNNFQYGFGYDFSKAKDPVVEFLKNRPQAHCELFAASMTLMMRTQGIPARYINGFVCVERSYAGDYYVVRVRDAHAWVEVWDGKAWRTLDPTPPSALQAPKDWGSWFDSMREAFNYYTRNLSKLDWREVLAAVWSKRAYWGVLILLAALWRARKTEWFPRSAAALKAHPQSQWIRDLSAVLEKRGLARQHWETLLLWADRIRDQEPEVADWLGEYSAFRYGGCSVAELESRLNAHLKRLQSPPS